MKWGSAIVFAALQSLLLGSVEADSFDELTFKLLVTKLENDALELAREVEQLYKRRCDTETMNSCRNANHGECQSAYPNQQCLGGHNFVLEQCSTGSSICAGLWDYTVSTANYPKAQATGVDGNPSDPSVIESICFSRYLDEWFIKKFAGDKNYWKEFGVEPQSMYFGSHTGAFRIYPARQSENCGAYDPRVRPWYVAGSSGPKNVVLILDVSGSMDNKSRLNNLKQAAKRVVSTLTVSDRILIVPFSSTAAAITDNGFVFKATDENKKFLFEKIDQLRANGSTNFYDGFLKAFDALEASAKNEYTAGCNTAVLFLTDGENTDGPDLGEVSKLVNTRIERLSNMLNKPVLLFTYSVSESSDANVHVYPRELACSVELGVWSKITNSDDILDALSSYYRLFALGLGSNNNANFTAWVEPYLFATGNVLGTTISAPVYDRSKTPYLFLGVVGIDIVMDALDAALAKKDPASAVTGSARAQELRDESIRKVVEASDASCPPELNLSPCEMQAYRTLSTPGEEGLCNVNCSGIEVSQVQPEKCSAISDYPLTLFVEPGAIGHGYQGPCCRVGETTASDTCFNNDDDDDDEGPSVRLTVGVVFGAVAGLCICVTLFFFYRNRSRENRLMGETQFQGNLGAPPTNPVWTAIPVPIQFASAPVVPPSEPSVDEPDSDADSGTDVIVHGHALQGQRVDLLVNL